MESISNDELEQHFDAGADITPYMDVSTARHPNKERTTCHISMDIPEDIIRGLDYAAARMGVDRQAVINVWLSERLDEEADRETRRYKSTPAY